MADPQLEQSLREVSAAIAEHRSKAADLETMRDQMIARALHAGWPHAQIAQASGLSRGRIGQLALRER